MEIKFHILHNPEKVLNLPMEKIQVNIDINTIGMAVKEYARSRAFKAGSYIVYKEKGDIVNEDPRTGKKVITKVAEKK